jgi:hypothetical protein
VVGPFYLSLLDVCGPITAVSLNDYGGSALSSCIMNFDVLHPSQESTQSLQFCSLLGSQALTPY